METNQKCRLSDLSHNGYIYNPTTIPKAQEHCGQGEERF